MARSFVAQIQGAVRSCADDMLTQIRARKKRRPPYVLASSGGTFETVSMAGALADGAQAGRTSAHRWEDRKMSGMEGRSWPGVHQPTLPPPNMEVHRPL